ncbi:MAG: hypothetical protein OIN86_15230 [Candidatus Methanoperedens sp.]|nr:hypothetical protein [Candidatus Methanoperedens sp.]CAG0974528.1 hypothetical protein METP1_01430 [Methanosarcinales archaeon]
MKSTNISRILTPLIMALFILSLFSGTVASQAMAKEQYEKTKEQYQIQKEKYDNTRNQFEDAKKLFEEANKRFKNVRDNKSNNRSNEDLMEKARNYILKAINHTQAQLQVMKNRLDNPENKGISATDAIKIIDAHTAQLEQLKGKVSGAATIEEIRDAHKELAGIVVKINLETRYFMGIVLNHRIDNFINQADNVSAKVDTAIVKLKANGTDTTKLEADAAEFKIKVTEARDIQAQTLALFATHSGFAQDGTVTNEKDARTFLNKANELQRDTIKKLKEASKQLIEFGKEFRKLVGRNVKVGEKGELEVNGGSTATLTPGE